MKFRKNYFLLFLLILTAEIAIALLAVHKFVRGFVGDVLVIPLVYTLVRAFTTLSVKKSLIFVLGIALMVETLQWFKLADKLELESIVGRTILGNTFDPWDLVAYGLGGILILTAEYVFGRKL